MFALTSKTVLPLITRARTSARTYLTIRRTGGIEGPRSVSRRKPPPERVVFRDELPDYATETQNASEPISNSLLAPVHIPEDPNGVLKSSHPAARLLGNSALVIQRELELGNLLLGFEQANKYVIMDPNGNHVGFIAEEESGIAKIVARQWFRTHRAFTTHVFDEEEREVLRFHRPFSFINSRIRVFDPINPTSTSTSTTAEPSALRIIGECQQQWHLLRRKYNLFLYHDPITGSYASRAGEQIGGPVEDHGVFTQFAYVDEPFLSWDFSLLSADDQLIGSVNRNFAGFGREIFTDTGVYALRMDSASAASEPKHLISNTHQGRAIRDGVESGGGRGMTLDERAVMMATAVTIDFDYFSRHSGHGGGFGFFPFFPMGGEYTDPSGQTRRVGEDTSMFPPWSPGGQVGQSGDQNGPFGGGNGGGGVGDGGEGGGGDWPWGE
ncbi:Scramblase-domain-containing protein [Terfezia boudieri ATCC MYA-4762]|uniref:Phospholipid scramblase n=1 Tax=Terfezia boudieri ATCC MYA-4762 TaxID=1051890 RepID=A0A3N4LUV4_9PEZI|nr:Scramblase-domain-containing protein [Terfezia boudieri ATCC MYA-4762]